MKELVKNGHEVYAICPNGDYSEKFSQFGIKHIAYKINRSSLNPINELITIYRIYKAIKPLKLDILHNFTVKPNIYGTLAGKIAGVKTIICSVTGLGSFYIDNSLKARAIRLLIEWLYKLVFKITSGIIFQNSTDLNYFLQKKILDQKKAHLIRSSGIDTHYFSPTNKAKKDDEVVVLMIARAIWHKGVREYYKAAEIAKKEMPNLRFLYVGGTDNGNIACADEKFLKSSPFVEYLGERKDIKDLIDFSDIVVLLSYREGVPRTLLEAASMAKPIVATNAIGCIEVVKDGINGFLVPIKDSQSAAKKIIELAKNKELREFFGKNGREIAINEFDVKKVVDGYLEIYKLALK